MDVITIVRYTQPNGEGHLYYQHNPALSMQQVKDFLLDTLAYVNMDIAEDEKAKEGSEGAEGGA